MAARAPAKKPQGKRMSVKVVEDEGYQLRYERAAGKRTSLVWECGATVTDIEAAAAVLADAGVQMISMESTSDYWWPWWLVLEEAGLPAQLVNSSQARNLPGRPKSDKDDAQWIARLTEMGMLRPSFVPPPQIRALRVLTRQAVHLTQDRTRYWQRLEKLLETARCKLSSVASRLAGNMSVRAMLEAMIAGERDPRALADLARTVMRAKRADLVKAFTGMRFGPGHALAAAQDLRMIDLLTKEIEDLCEQAREHVKAIPGGWDAVCRLAEVPGVTEEGAIGLIAEIGLDMSRFPTAGHLVSWTGTAPVPHQSGPRQGRAKKGKGNTYARRIATAAGLGAASSDTFLGERHRRIRQRPGGGGWKKANCAVGRSILVIAWHLLNDPAARYADLGPDHYARHADTSRKVRGAIRQIESLGYDVVVTPRQAA
jgi:transposase